MFHLRHSISIFAFFAVCTFIMMYSLFADFSDSIWDKLRGVSEKKKMLSHFKNAQLFAMKRGSPNLFLDAEAITINHDLGEVFFTYPKGNTYTSDREEVFYQAVEGELYKQKEQLILKNNVILKSVNSKINADYATYYMNTGIANSRGNVKSYLYLPKSKDEIYINSDTLESNIPKELGNYKGNVKGRLIRERSYEEGIDFSSNILFFNIPNMKAHLLGDVSLKKERSKAWAREGYLFLENYNKKLKYFSLHSDVKVREKVIGADGKVIIRRAYAEDLEGLMKEQIIVLTGYPKVYQGGDVVRGNKIILREDNSVIEVDDASSNFRVRK